MIEENDENFEKISDNLKQTVRFYEISALSELNAKIKALIPLESGNTQTLTKKPGRKRKILNGSNINEIAKFFQRESQADVGKINKILGVWNVNSCENEIIVRNVCFRKGDVVVLHKNESNQKATINSIDKNNIELTSIDLKPISISVSDLTEKKVKFIKLRKFVPKN